jgi:hypothetical protein
MGITVRKGIPGGAKDKAIVVRLRKQVTSDDDWKPTGATTIAYTVSSVYQRTAGNNAHWLCR